MDGRQRRPALAREPCHFGCCEILDGEKLCDGRAVDFIMIAWRRRWRVKAFSALLWDASRNGSRVVCELSPGVLRRFAADFAWHSDSRGERHCKIDIRAGQCDQGACANVLIARRGRGDQRNRAYGPPLSCRKAARAVISRCWPKSKRQIRALIAPAFSGSMGDRISRRCLNGR